MLEPSHRLSAAALGGIAGIAVLIAAVACHDPPNGCERVLQTIARANLEMALLSAQKGAAPETIARAVRGMATTSEELGVELAKETVGSSAVAAYVTEYAGFARELGGSLRAYAAHLDALSDARTPGVRTRIVNAARAIGARCAALPPDSCARLHRMVAAALVEPGNDAAAYAARLTRARTALTEEMLDDAVLRDNVRELVSVLGQLEEVANAEATRAAQAVALEARERTLRARLASLCRAK